ncbi:hypothetical protein FisN_22Lu161 [Fistulifera solaris]|uniref:Uncharacterized protein n=1 Tax=Fistulifera solaris TaxID=1519565 RepID=A0A1Z5JBY5_FISSO|nr:hypothetical protein FisN_22Lu161 [Fistulifera solaris]|eukprot:GAX11466.1 hypothetical protein FisN_22Lu161 [Fistulifera solaris]
MGCACPRHSETNHFHSMERSARCCPAQVKNGEDADVVQEIRCKMLKRRVMTIKCFSYKHHASKDPNNWFATLFPVTNNFIDHGDGTSSPKSLATLAAEAVYRYLATSTERLPGPLPPDVVEELTSTLRMALAHNPTTWRTWLDLAIELGDWGAVGRASIMIENLSEKNREALDKMIYAGDWSGIVYRRLPSIEVAFEAEFEQWLDADY